MSSNSGLLGLSGEGERLRYRLCLFVAGREPNSLKAMAVLSRLCESYLRGQHELVVVDVLEDYQAAIDYQIMVVPTLIVEAPLPRKTIVGSLSDEEKVLAMLGLSKSGEEA